MAQVAQATLGPNAYLFHEQWVIKGAEQGMKFAWHQDSGYVKFYDNSTYHKPYLTCWCPLDDVSEENGTVYLLLNKNGKYKELREADLLNQAATLLKDPSLRLVKGQLLVPTISFQAAEEQN